MEELRVMTQQKQAEGTPVVYYVSGVENSECVVFIHAAFADLKKSSPAETAYLDEDEAALFRNGELCIIRKNWG